MIGKNRLLLLCVSIPSIMINLDSNIVAVSLPSIARSLHADFTAIEWVISAYTLTFASLLMPAGALADRYGRKRMMLVGLTIFTLASLMCGAAPSTLILNAARAFQGVGAALQLTAGLALLSHSFQGPERGRAFAFWGSAIGIAIACGPIVGGFITHSFGWNWAFYVNVPVGVVMIAIIARTVGESRDPGAKRIDLAGVATFTGALFLATFALISANHAGWADSAVELELMGAAVLFAAFLVAESLQARPMLDLSFFRRPTYIGASITGLAYAACLLTMLSLLPIYFQNGLGQAPLAAGLMMLPMALPLFIVPRIVASNLAYRFSGRELLTGGLAMVAAGLLWLGATVLRIDYVWMLPGLLLAGIGAGILNGETAKVSMTVIPPERAGMASGIGGTIRFAGIVLGFAALGAILFGRVLAAASAALPSAGARTQAALAHDIVAGNLQAIPLALHDLARVSFAQGYQAIFMVAAGFATLSALLSWLFIRGEETAASSRPVPATQG